MKKTAVLLMSVILTAGLLTACGGGNNNEANNTTPPAQNEQQNNGAGQGEEAKWSDGTYYAEGEYAEKSGWKEVVAIRVQDGKITNVNWNGLHKDGGLDKKTASAKGLYGMVKNGGAQAEWHEQAAKVEQYLLEKQDVAALNVSGEGTTDAVSGVSIGVDTFAQLVDAALDAGAVEAGPYKDGAYHAEAADFDPKSGWKETIDVTVIAGKIAAVQWNGVHKDGGDDKVTKSKDGSYGMVKNGGAQAEWHEQAQAAEQFLLEKQDPAAIPYNEADGYTDAISGVSIHVNGFVELAQKALEQAK